MRYDPEKAPDPTEWLELDESARINAVEDQHMAAGEDVPNPMVHAAFHVTVENQLASGVEAVVSTMTRLRREGLTRHDALHAIGSVLAGHMHNLLKEEPAEGDPNEAYFRDLEELTADRWRRGG
jgi:hypothetical protein